MIVWIAITKLLIKQGSDHEDAEKATDYLAMHVYKNDTPNSKITSAGNPLVKSTYTNEQCIMLYVKDLKAEVYIGTGKLLNLVLDQTKRKKSLYFKVEIFSSVNFSASRVGKKYLHK